MKFLARALLHVAEEFFLYVYGWKYIGNDTWERPDFYDVKRNDGEPYRTGHAVNSQKWTNSRDARERLLREHFKEHT